MLGMMLFALTPRETGAQGVDLVRPYSGDFRALDDEAAPYSSLFKGHYGFLTLSTRLLHDTTIVDFEKRQVTIVRCDSLGFIVWTHHYAELSEYLAERERAALANAWFTGARLLKSQAGQEKQQNLTLAWELPVQYPSWAQRILGKDPPRLSINGSLRIKMAYEDTRRRESSILQQSQGAGKGFVFDEQNQFTVSGSVGRLININISANSESDVDVNNPLKNFKIDYKESKPGELEDEIVQEVTAGYTGFSMPGTQLSGYSESHEGLFGIKVTSRIGPLTFTTIASNEQGESQKLSISNNGQGGQGGMTATKESQFKTNKYFFLDTAYVGQYNKKYGLLGGNPSYQLQPSDLEVRELQVWRKVYNPNEVATLVANGRIVRSLFRDSTAGDKDQFELLQPERHYRLYPKEGWLRFTDSISIRDDDLIAIYLRTNGTSLKKGGDKDTSGYPSSLWVLKPDLSIDSLGADRERFRLMWRNVYDIPGGDMDPTKFQLRVYYTKKDDQDTTKTIGNSVYLADAMGLTKNGIVAIERQDIFSFENRELVIPPFDTSAGGNEPFVNPAFRVSAEKDLRDSLIYRFGPNSRVLSQSNGDYVPTFTIEMSGSSKKTTFDLGIGVMENTVQVRADGRQLQPNIDYVLNTEIGRLELISPSAKAAEKIDINFQREALFMPERKLFLGARAEMKLPFLSDNSLMGLSVLYQSTSISQDIPRINQEPFSKLLFDFNTRLDFAPAWMTALANKISFVKTETASSATVDFEIAHSRMNPNTDKEAYVDDFESSKQIYSLGEGYRSWYRASPPFNRDSIVNHPPAWDFYWFSPVYTDTGNSVQRDQVWLPDPGRVYTGMDKYESVLRLHCQPAPTNPALASRQILFQNAWAGIMTPIPVSMADRKRDQYFELLVKVNRGAVGRGRLRIQMGRLREDICINGAPPNGRADREDTSYIWRENRDPALDLGLDRLADRDEYYLIPNFSGGWDTLRYDDPRWEGIEWAKDPAKDNYRLYNEEFPGPGRYACRYDKDGLANETEDIDNNGSFELNTPEKYHEFTIDLNDETSPYIDRSAKLKPGQGWHRYRIPLHEIIAGHPGIRRDSALAPDDWSNIRMVRLVWDGFDPSRLSEENQLILTGMQFVGNQWEAVRDSLGAAKIGVSAIGTREDSVYYREVQTTGLIRRQLDETNILQPEQSLRLNFHDVGPGNEALAQRSFSYQALNVASYDSLTLVVYGRDTTEPGFLRALDRSDLKFVFRFGSDTSTYYEYRRTIRPRWDNFVCVNLRSLSDLKLAWQTLHPGDSINAWNADSSLHIKAPRGRQPNFANIVWMAVGVVCDRNSSAAPGYAGELWVDELKVVGIKRFNGWASRLNLQTKWADLLNFSAGLDYQGGDFRTMTDSKISMGDSRLSGNLNLSTGLDKFMPKEWGVLIPIGGSITSSLSRPQLKPNTDIYLTDKNNKPDGFVEMVRDVIGASNATPTEAEHFETQSYSRNFFINYSKTSTSTNPAVDMLLQRLTTQFQYNMSSSHTNRGRLRPDSDENYVDSTLNRTYSGGLNYDLSPHNPPRWTKWKPLEKSTAAWLPQRWKELEFSLLPTTVSLNLASATYTNSMERRFEPGDTTLKFTKDFTVNHGVQINFAPIRPIIDISYSLTVNRDFPNNGDLDHAGSAFRFMGDKFFGRNINTTWKNYTILRNERSRSQQFKMTLNPQFVDWLTNTADYTASYAGSLSRLGNDSTEFMNAKVNSGMNFSSTLTFGSLFQKASDSGRIMEKIAAKIKKGFDFIGFSSLSFTYTSSADLTNNYLGPDYLSPRVTWSDFMAYQLGLNSNIISGDMNDNTAFGGMRYRMRNDSYNYYKDDNRSTNRTYQVSTSLRLSKPIDLSLSPISLQATNRSAFRPDTLFSDNTWSFPDFRIGLQSSVLDKIALLKRYVQGVNLSSSYSIRRNSNTSSAAGTMTNTTYELSPLVSVSGTVKKWPISFSYQHTVGKDKRESHGNATTTAHDGDNMDMSYEIQKTTGLSTIKLFKWSIPVRGRASMGMRFSRDHQKTVTAGANTSDVSNLSLTPHLSYIFTDNVTGTLEYTGSRITDNGATTSTNTMALIAEIKF
jgi:hypothetical protein